MPSTGYYSFLFLSLLVARPFLASIYAFAQGVAARTLAPHNTLRVFLGGYGEGRPHWGWEVRHLRLWFSWQFLYWPASLCDFTPGHKIRWQRQIAILLAGPLAILALSGGAVWLLLTQETWGPVRFASALLLFLAVFHLVRALSADMLPSPLAGGGLIMGDGHRLRILLRYRDHAEQVFQLLWHWEKDEFEEVAMLSGRLLAAGLRQKDIFEYAIYSNLIVADWSRANACHTAMAALHKVDATDLSHLGYLQSAQGDPNAALTTLNEALRQTPGNHITLCQRAHLHIDAGDYAAARLDLDRAIRFEPEFAYGYAHRGWLNLMEGHFEAAQQDLLKSLEIDPLHNRSYLHLGALYRRLGALKKAQSAWETARLLAVPEQELEAFTVQFPAQND